MSVISVDGYDPGAEAASCVSDVMGGVQRFGNAEVSAVLGRLVVKMSSGSVTPSVRSDSFQDSGVVARSVGGDHGWMHQKVPESRW